MHFRREGSLKNRAPPLISRLRRAQPAIIEKMPTISKDSVSHLTVGSEEAGQRLDNYLVKILKGVP